MAGRRFFGSVEKRAQLLARRAQQDDQPAHAVGALAQPAQNENDKQVDEAITALLAYKHLLHEKHGRQAPASRVGKGA